MTPSIILASTSVYRAQALAQFDIPFTSADPKVQERRISGESARAQSQRLACEKATAVAKTNPYAIVIGADQVGECKGKLLHKPLSVANAIKGLCEISGKQATFYSALAVYCPKRQTLFKKVVATRLVFRTISRQQAKDYVQKDRPLDCAGGFKIESLGIALFEQVSAKDPSALIGLPLIALTTMLNDCGVQLV